MMPMLRQRRGHSWRQSAPILCVIVLASLLAGSMAAAHRDAGHSAQVHDAPVWSTNELPARGQPATAPLSAPDLTLQLQAVLGHHSVLAADMMRARIAGDDDYTRAANDAVNKNTDEITKVIESIVGADAASQFKLLWSAHVTALMNYAAGQAKNDQAVRDEGRTSLVTFERNLAGFLSDGSQGRLRRDAAEAAVYMHVNHLLQQADAYASRNYAEANRIYREAYTHTFALGGTLAGAFLPADKAAALQSPVWRLRSELGRLLGEHVVVVVAAFRSGVMNAPDFAAAGDAVNANTRDLTGAIDALFGAAAATRFQALWADHVDQLMAYTSGVVTHDATRRETAVSKLKAFESQFAAFLASATADKLPAEALGKVLLMHDQMLLAQVDACAAKRYQQANEGTYSTYEHMLDVAKQLADAFGVTVASRLPVGAPHTGFGGTAHDHRARSR